MDDEKLKQVVLEVVQADKKFVDAILYQFDKNVRKLDIFSNKYPSDKDIIHVMNLLGGITIDFTLIHEAIKNLDSPKNEKILTVISIILKKSLFKNLQVIKDSTIGMFHLSDNEFQQCKKDIIELVDVAMKNYQQFIDNTPNFENYKFDEYRQVGGVQGVRDFEYMYK